MIRFGEVIGLAVFLLVASCVPTVQPPQSAGSGRAGAVEDSTTIWDGIYTTEQATRGERTAWRNCFSCHTTAEWRNPRFMNLSSGQRLGDLYQTISRSMPMDAPGRLSAEEYADIVAYMLRLQGAPAGNTELPSDLEALDRIKVTPADDDP